VSAYNTDIETQHATVEKSNDMAITACPNPFNPAVVISVGAPFMRERSVVRMTPLQLKIYTISGRFITDLETHDGIASWDASNMPSGIYIIRAKAGNAHLSKKIILAR
jgi:hypothetical protein